MSLSDPKVLNYLHSNFVCGFRDITGEPWAGKSGKHEADGAAVMTTNGAGPHNVQLFVLDPDGTVLTCLPGFWESEDLLSELDLARQLDHVWKGSGWSREQKDRMWVRAQMDHLKSHPQAEVERSHLQGFDAKEEEERKGESKLRFAEGDYRPKFELMNGVSRKYPDLMSVDEYIHVALARHAFEPYDQFDVADYTHYGKNRYDKNEDRKEAEKEGKVTTPTK